LVTQFVQHMIDRYGINEVSTWFFEVWNEPNCGFWSGTYQEYFYMLKITADTIHAINPNLKVGGPASCASGLIEETLGYMKNGTIKIDFISTHIYPTDFTPINNTVMKTVLGNVRKAVGNIPLFYTEYNDGLYGSPPFHDTVYASSFIMKTITDCSGLVDMLSWWTFTDIFEEQGLVPGVFNKSEGWGLISLYDVKKPSYRAFQMLHQTGSSRIKSTPDPNFYPTVGVLGTANLTHLTIQIYNNDVPDKPPSPLNVCITVPGYTGAVTSGVLRRIDENHVNPYAAWRKMGTPRYPTQSQIQQLKQAAEFVVESQPVSVNGLGLSFTITIPPQGRHLGIHPHKWLLPDFLRMLKKSPPNPSIFLPESLHLKNDLILQLIKRNFYCEL